MERASTLIDWNDADAAVTWFYDCAWDVVQYPEAMREWLGDDGE